MSLTKSRNTLIIAFVGGFMLLAGALFLFSQPVEAGGRPLTAVLSGDNEVPSGDPDGSGMMYLTLNQGQEEICWDLSYEGITTPVAAHIHDGPAGVNGPVVVGFFGGEPVLSGCLSASADLIKDIRQNPHEYYINVHNPDFPGGAIRGQLSK